MSEWEAMRDYFPQIAAAGAFLVVTALFVIAMRLLAVFADPLRRYLRIRRFRKDRAREPESPRMDVCRSRREPS